MQIEIECVLTIRWTQIEMIDKLYGSSRLEDHGNALVLFDQLIDDCL